MTDFPRGYRSAYIAKHPVSAFFPSFRLICQRRKSRFACRLQSISTDFQIYL